MGRKMNQGIVYQRIVLPATRRVRPPLGRQLHPLLAEWAPPASQRRLAQDQQKTSVEGHFRLRQNPRWPSAHAEWAAGGAPLEPCGSRAELRQKWGRNLTPNNEMMIDNIRQAGPRKAARDTP